MAPSSLMPRTASTNSGLLSVMSMTRSPLPTPRRANASAKRLLRSCSWDHVVVWPRNRNASASGCISAWVATHVFQLLRRAAWSSAMGSVAVVMISAFRRAMGDGRGT